MRRYSDPHPEFVSPSEVVFGRQRRVSLSSEDEEEDGVEDYHDGKKISPAATAAAVPMWSGPRRNSWSLNDHRAYTHALAEINHNATSPTQQPQFSPPRSWNLLLPIKSPKSSSSAAVPRSSAPPPQPPVPSPSFPVPPAVPQARELHHNHKRIQRAPSPIGERMLKGDFDPF